MNESTWERKVSLPSYRLHSIIKRNQGLILKYNRDTMLTDFSQAHLQLPCLYSPGPLAQRWHCSQFAMLYYINYQSTITPQRCCKPHTSQQRQQLLRTQEWMSPEQAKIYGCQGKFTVCSRFRERFGSRMGTRSDSGRVSQAYGEIHNSLRKIQQGDTRWYEAIPDLQRKSPSAKYQFHRGKGQFNPNRTYTPNWTLQLPSLKEKR